MSLIATNYRADLYCTFAGQKYLRSQNLSTILKMKLPSLGEYHPDLVPKAGQAQTHIRVYLFEVHLLIDLSYRHKEQDQDL